MSSSQSTATTCACGSLNIAYAKACSYPISFDDVFYELQNYKRANNSLTIPPDHPSFSKVVDTLAALDIDSVILKRWLQRLAILQSLDLGSSPTFPPVTGKWIQTQLDHYSLYTTGLPNPLFGEQVTKLREIGIQRLLTLRSAAEKQAKNSLETNAAMRTLGTDENKNTDVDFGNPIPSEEAVTQAAADNINESGAKLRDTNDMSGTSLAVVKEEMSNADNNRQSESADSIKRPKVKQEQGAAATDIKATENIHEHEDRNNLAEASSSQPVSYTHLTLPTKA